MSVDATSVEAGDGWQATMSHRWPNSIDERRRDEDRERSRQLVAGLVANGAETVRVSFRRGRLGRVAVVKVTGPPRWRFPKARLLRDRSSKGRPVLAGGIGWRFTLYEFTWIIGEPS